MDSPLSAANCVSFPYHRVPRA